LAQVLEINPENIAVLERRYELLKALGKFDEAQKELEKIKAIKSKRWNK